MSLAKSEKDSKFPITGENIFINISQIVWFYNDGALHEIKVVGGTFHSGQWLDKIVHSEANY